MVIGADGPGVRLAPESDGIRRYSVLEVGRRDGAVPVVPSWICRLPHPGGSERADDDDGRRSRELEAGWSHLMQFRSRLI